MRICFHVGRGTSSIKVVETQTKKPCQITPVKHSFLKITPQSLQVWS